MRVLNSSLRHVRRTPVVVETEPIQPNGTIELQTFENSRPVARPTKPGADMRLCAGDWVEVRSKEEILSTLDKNGRLRGTPLHAANVQVLRPTVSGLQAGAQDLRHRERRLRRPPPPRRGSSRAPLRWSSLRWLSGRLLDILEGGMA